MTMTSSSSTVAVALSTVAVLGVSAYMVIARRRDERPEHTGSFAGHNGGRVAFTIFRRPAARPPLHGVVLLSDAGGVDEEPTRGFARRIVEETGMTVMLPDVFRGEPWSDARPRSEYESWRATHPAQRVDGDTAAAIVYLSKRCSTVSVVGLCFGGGAGWRASVSAGDRTRLCAAALCYPTRIDAASSTSQGGIAAPTLCVFGDQDHLTPEGYIHEIRVAMERSAAPARLRVMAGVGHGFIHKPSTPLEEAAAKDAFATILRFLRWAQKYSKPETFADAMREGVDEFSILNKQGGLGPGTPRRQRTISAGYDDADGLMQDIDAASTAPYSPDDDDDDAEEER